MQGGMVPSSGAGGTAEVRALLFDVFGTVTNWRASLIAQGQAFGRARGIAIDWAAFADAWRRLYGPSMQRVRSGELPWHNLDTLQRRSLEELLDRFGVAGLSENDKQHLVGMWHRLEPYPDSVPGLLRLKARYTIATLSNGNMALQVEMAKRAGLPWDCLFATELWRTYKPDPVTYTSAAELLGLPPGHVMMVAAHVGDLMAAHALGLRTAYVYRPLEWGPENIAPFRPDPAFDIVAMDFVDLAHQLGA